MSYEGDGKRCEGDDGMVCLGEEMVYEGDGGMCEGEGIACEDEWMVCKGDVMGVMVMGWCFRGGV